MSITTHHTMQIFSLIIFTTTTLVLQSNYCFCSIINSEYSTNGSLAGSVIFQPAVATWYGGPVGAASNGNSDCGYGEDLPNAPYSGLVASGSKNLYKNGQGCGNCYQVRCIQNPACSGFPVTVTITEECTSCNSDAYDHFNLTGKAFGFLAKHGQADILRSEGTIIIEYQRVPCHYNANITFKIVDSDPDPYHLEYLAFVVENVNGYGDISSVELFSAEYPPEKPITMRRVRGMIWESLYNDIGRSILSVKLTSNETNRSVVAEDVIPPKYAMGTRYASKVNF